MAIIKCKECGKEISNKAKVCPYCGFSEKRMPTCKTVNLCLVSGMLLVLASVVAFWLITATRICGPKEFMPCLIADILCAAIALIMLLLSFKWRQDIKNKTGEYCFSWWSVVLLTIGICLIAIGVCCTSLFDYSGFGAIGLCASELSGVLMLVTSVLKMLGKKYPANFIRCSICVLLFLIPISYYVDSKQKEKSDLARVLEKKGYTLSENEADKSPNNSSNIKESIQFGKEYVSKDNNGYIYKITLYSDGSMTYYEERPSGYSSTDNGQWVKKQESRRDILHSWIELRSGNPACYGKTLGFIDENMFLYGYQDTTKRWDDIENGKHKCKLHLSQ